MIVRRRTGIVGTPSFQGQVFLNYPGPLPPSPFASDNFPPTYAGQAVYTFEHPITVKGSLAHLHTVLDTQTKFRIDVFEVENYAYTKVPTSPAFSGPLTLLTDDTGREWLFCYFNPDNIDQPGSAAWNGSELVPSLPRYITMPDAPVLLPSEEEVEHRIASLYAPPAVPAPIVPPPAVPAVHVTRPADLLTSLFVVACGASITVLLLLTLLRFLARA